VAADAGRRFRSFSGGFGPARLHSALGAETFLKTFRKTIYALFLGFFAMELIAGVGVHLCYSSNLPTVQDDKSGHVHRMVVNHGFVVYGTNREFRAYRWIENLQPFAVVGGFVVLILGLRFGDFKWAPGRKPNE
jgi:hypothetical protein